MKLVCFTKINTYDPIYIDMDAVVAIYPSYEGTEICTPRWQFTVTEEVPTVLGHLPFGALADL